MTDTPTPRDEPTIRRVQTRGVTLSRDELVAEAMRYQHGGGMAEAMADFAMMIASRVAIRLAVPRGHVVVPSEPTAEMLEAGERDENAWRTMPTPPVRLARHYRAMIAAATKEIER